MDQLSLDLPILNPVVGLCSWLHVYGLHCRKMTEVQCPLPSRVATTHGAWTLPFLPLSLKTVASHHTNHWHYAFWKIFYYFGWLSCLILHVHLEFFFHFKAATNYCGFDITWNYNFMSYILPWTRRYLWQRSLERKILNWGGNSGMQSL